ncbi:MAG: hypothetical protein JW779_11270 [Candidatus Thorarchaeota archaeon]|nr:hypothetical protein [Candidatus Thorarchaeota archaeon]
MNKIRIGFVTVLALSLFLSPTFLIGGFSSITSNPDNLRLAVNTEEIYGQSRKNDPVSILVYTQYADLSASGEFKHTMDSIDAEYGTSYQYANLTDYHGLAAVINEYDILLILEQENAYVSNMTEVGLAWASTLSTFITKGGIVIAMDCWGPLNIPAERLGITSHIYNSSGLMSITGFHDEPYTSMTIYDFDDALALGVTTPFSTTDGAITYDTTDGVKVAGSASGALAVHKIIGKGHLILLGFDFYLIEMNCVKMLANSIRLHHHVVVDGSHTQYMHVAVELYQFAVNLAAEGFAVSTMSTFDPAYLAACDVFVISYCTDMYNATEVNQIEDFVNNGGGLYILQEWSAFGEEMDPVSERFNYVRNKTSYLADSDDHVGANVAWVMFDLDNTHNHSAILDATSFEVYGATIFEELPANAFPLITVDTDDTATIGGDSKNGYSFAAASTHGNGRVIVIGDGNMMDGVDDIDSDATTNFDEQNNGYFAVSCIRWLLAAGIEEKTILFDESHSPYGFVNGANQYLAYFLTLNGYTVHWMESFYGQLLAQADILFVMSGSSAYTPTEINQIVDFVNNGKSIFLIGDWGIYGTNIAPIGSEFGLELNTTTSYLDDTDDWLHAASYLVYNTSNFADHPIMTGVNRIEVDRGTGFSAVGTSTPLVHTDTDGTAFWRNMTSVNNGPANGIATFASTTYNKGRVVFFTDVNFIQGTDADSDGVIQLYDSDNDRFISNAFYWLIENRAPTVELTFPNGGEVLNGTHFITWDAIDFDNDLLTFDLYYSDNNGSDWTTLVMDLTLSEYAWNTTVYDDGNGYMIRVVVSDGIATDQDESDDSFSLDNFESGPGGFPLDTTLLLLIAAAAGIIIVVIVVIMKRGKK